MTVPLEADRCGGDTWAEMDTLCIADELGGPC